MKESEESFPKEHRDKLIETISNGLKNKGFGPEMYEERLNDLLEVDDVLEIYEATFLKDVSKIDCPLFKKYKNRSDDYVKFGEVLADNLEKIKISTPEQAEALKEELFDVVWVCKGKLKPESLEKLKEARQKLVEKLKDQEEKKVVK